MSVFLLCPHFFFLSPSHSISFKSLSLRVPSLVKWISLDTLLACVGSHDEIHWTLFCCFSISVSAVLFSKASCWSSPHDSELFELELFGCPHIFRGHLFIFNASAVPTLCCEICCRLYLSVPFGKCKMDFWKQKNILCNRLKKRQREPYTYHSIVFCDNRKIIPSYLTGILLLSFFGQFHETAIHMSSTLVASPLSLSLVSVSLSVP